MYSTSNVLCKPTNGELASLGVDLPCIMPLLYPLRATSMNSFKIRYWALAIHSI